jgi:predicted ester cyclase
VVRTYKTDSGTHDGESVGLAPTGRHVELETVDAMRVSEGKISERWGVADLYSVPQQIGAMLTPDGK